MALTRSQLKGLGLNAEQIDAVIESHSETVDALKKQISEMTDSVSKLQTVQKELDDLKAQGGSFEQKYNDEHAAFEDFKKQIDAEHLRTKQNETLDSLLTESGIARDSVRKLIRQGYDLNKISFDDQGNLKDHDNILNAIKTDYSDFIGTQSNNGTPPTTPPVGNSGAALTIDAIRKMTPEQINKQWSEVSKALSDNK